MFLNFSAVAQDCRQSYSGLFSGKDLFVQNPFISREKGHCVKQLIINDSAFIFSEGTVFLLDLKKLNYVDGDSVNITFVHDCGCKPKFLNPPHHLPTALKNSKLSLSEDSSLVFQSTEKIKSNTYYLQQFRWNRWNVIDTFIISRTDTVYYFQVKDFLHSGENRFRIADGASSFTQPLKISGFSTDDFIPAEAYIENTISFPYNTCYEIWNELGSKILSGCGNHIDISKLYKGQFYLNYDNKTVKFIRK